MLGRHYRLLWRPTPLYSQVASDQAKNIRQEQDGPCRIAAQCRPDLCPVERLPVSKLVQHRCHEGTPRVGQLPPHKSTLRCIKPDLIQNHARQRNVIGCQTQVSVRLPTRFVEYIYALSFLRIDAGRKRYAAQRLPQCELEQPIFALKKTFAETDPGESVKTESHRCRANHIASPNQKIEKTPYVLVNIMIWVHQAVPAWMDILALDIGPLEPRHRNSDPTTVSYEEIEPLVQRADGICQEGTGPFVIRIEEGHVRHVGFDTVEPHIPRGRRPGIFLVNDFDRAIPQQITDLFLGRQRRAIVDHHDGRIDAGGILQHRAHALAQKPSLTLEIRYHHRNLCRSHGHGVLSMKRPKH